MAANSSPASPSSQVQVISATPVPEDDMRKHPSGIIPTLQNIVSTVKSWLPT